jgi:hypothetical protein
MHGMISGDHAAMFGIDGTQRLLLQQSVTLGDSEVLD